MLSNSNSKVVDQQYQHNKLIIFFPIGIHCTITLTQLNEYMITSYTSNYVAVNGNPIKKEQSAIIKHQDKITIGANSNQEYQINLQFYIEDQFEPNQSDKKIKSETKQILEHNQLEPKDNFKIIEQSQNQSEQKLTPEIDDSSKKLQSEQKVNIIDQVESKQSQPDKQLPQSEIIKKDQETMNKNDNQIIQNDEERLGEEFICTICDEIMAFPVTISPCLHNFCAVCFTKWMNKQKEQKSQITCPNCRKDAVQVQKNHFVSNILDKFLKKHPDLKRPDDEIKKLKKMDEIQERTIDLKEFVNNQLEKKALKIATPENNEDNADSEEDEERNYSDEENEDDEDEEENNMVRNPANRFFQYQPNFFNNNNNNFQQGGLFAQPLFQPQVFNVGHQQFYANNNAYQIANQQKCRNCQGQEGFFCHQDQVHIYCFSCGKGMPKRVDNYEQNLQYQQRCEFCKRSFCNLYYKDNINKCPNVVQRNLILFKDCINDNNKLVNPKFFKHLNYEYQFFYQYLQKEDIQLDYIVQYMKDTYIYQNQLIITKNKSLYPKHICDDSVEFILKDETVQFQRFFQTLIFYQPLCKMCIHSDIMFQILLRYVCTIKFEGTYDDRPECWYGVNCRQLNQPFHSKNYFHLCEQTKFN